MPSGLGMVLAFLYFSSFVLTFHCAGHLFFVAVYKMATITLKIMSVFKAGKKEHDSTSHIGLLNQGGQSTNHPSPPGSLMIS